MTAKQNRTIKLFGKDIRIPSQKASRVALGVALVFGGLFGFLPVLGFWMLPLGLLVLSVDFSLPRKIRRKLAVWWGRRVAPNLKSKNAEQT